MEVICKHGRRGQSFNKLAKEVQHFVSRSTLIAKIERLKRLNYVEKLVDDKLKQVRWIRGTLPTRMLMWHIARVKEKIKATENEIAEKVASVLKSLEEGKASASVINDFRGFVRDVIQKRVSIIFSTIAEIAIVYGEAAASHIFLPAIIENLRSLSSIITLPFQKKPELIMSIALGMGAPEERVEDVKAFFKEFGEELFEKASISPEARKAILTEVTKIQKFSPSS